jgi:hypothetical protein
VNDPFVEGWLAHYVMLARERGWWAYVEQQVRRMDSGPSGLFRGLEAAWRERLDAIGFTPDPSELGQWWNVKSEAEREAEQRSTARRRA